MTPKLQAIRDAILKIRPLTFADANERSNALALLDEVERDMKREVVTHCPYCNQHYQVYDCVIGEKCNKPLKSFKPEDRVLIETVQQAFREIDGSRRMGPSWYTKGESGMHAQVSMWIRKAKDALQAMITQIESPPAAMSEDV